MLREDLDLRLRRLRSFLSSFSTMVELMRVSNSFLDPCMTWSVEIELAYPTHLSFSSPRHNEFLGGWSLTEAHSRVENVLEEYGHPVPKILGHPGTGKVEFKVETLGRVEEAGIVGHKSRVKSSGYLSAPMAARMRHYQIPASQ